MKFHSKLELICTVQLIAMSIKIKSRRVELLSALFAEFMRIRIRLSGNLSFEFTFGKVLF